MPSDRSLVEREMQRVELLPFTLEGFHRQRERKQRNKRIRAGVLALVVTVLGTGALLRALPSGGVPADDPRSPFLGSWVSTDGDGSTQRMTIRAAADDTVEIEVHDDAASVCSGAPSTMVGTGRLEGGTELVIPSPMLTCDDGSEPEALSGPPLQDQLRDLTFVHDPEADALTDNFGTVWGREGAEDLTPVPYRFLDGEVTFAVATPDLWDEPWDGGAGDLSTFMIFNLDRSSMMIMADPLPADPDCKPGPAPADAEALVRSIRSNPDIDSTAPVPVRLGGVDALRMDVAFGPRAGCGELGLGPAVVEGASFFAGGELAGVMRLYFLDLPEGMSARILGIAVAAPDVPCTPDMTPCFQRVIEAAAPVLDSFEFQEGG